MKDDDLIISGFDSNADGELPFAVDFASAKQLKVGGSTCDAYECVVQRRRVFVKRLKAEYRNNPLYRAAFDKEFDLGVSLSHPSLPRYVGFGGDYIVMDFVEGDTLADLIARGDRRLKNRKFVRKLLRELTDVADYLHNRNIVHCDIKADNIIISPYADRPITLIDLDKAYSPWLDSSHGDVTKYGCDLCADGAIDFKGIGLIAEQLGAGRFTSRSIIWPASGALIVIAVIFAGLWFRPAAPVHHESTMEIEIPDSIASDSICEATPESLVGHDIAPVLDIDAIVKRHYAPLARRHDYLRTLAADSSTSARQLQIVFTSYAEAQNVAQGRIISDAMELYHFTDPWDVQPLFGLSREWKVFMLADAELNALYAREIDVRQAKESQRSSDLLVSQPDTLPGDTLSAPRR